MKVLVTGNQGYLGSLVTPELVQAGHDVTGLDTGFYADTVLYPEDPSEVITLTKDVRRVTVDDLAGFDAVVHMAELSNDPLGQLAPVVTREINHEGSVRLARLAREAGVQRFVYMSSCSVYGVAEGQLVDEDSAVNPQTVYAECKVLVERDVAALASEEFSPTFLRNATAYGASPHMRFDIVLNNLAGLAFTTREIRLTSDGTPWRPLVHGLDIAQAVIAILEAPSESVHNQILNVGATEHNYRIRDIAATVAEVFPNCRVSLGPPGPDNRSYRVSFARIQRVLPGFECRWNARRGAEELLEIFTRVGLTTGLFEYRAFTRLKQLQHLQKSGAIDAQFQRVP